MGVQQSIEKVNFEDVKLADGKIWEDWWINPTCFPQEIKQIACKGTFFEDCVYKLMEFSCDNE